MSTKNFLPMHLLQMVIKGMLFIFLTAAGWNDVHAQDFLTDNDALDRLQVTQIDSLQQYTGTLRGYRNASDYAFGILSRPGAGPEQQLKAELLMMFISSKLDEGIRNKTLNPCKDSVKHLIASYRERNMNFYHPQKSEAAKLVSYIEEGKFRYVYKRLSGLKHFTLWLVLFTVFVLCSLANVSGLIRWRYRKIVNRGLLVIVALAVLSLVFFYFYVKYYSSC